MRFSVALAALASLAAVSAETFTVMVGSNSSLTYSPTSVNVTEGDVIAFQFVSKNHTVTQSTFAAPCADMANGVDSGFMPIAAGTTEFPVWSFTVLNASAPMWFYCRQTGHCAAGMVFAVNPTAAKSFDAFQAAAKATGSNTTSTSGTTASSASGSVASASASVTPAASDALTLGRNAAGMLAVMGLVTGLLL